MFRSLHRPLARALSLVLLAGMAASPPVATGAPPQPEALNGSSAGNYDVRLLGRQDLARLAAAYPDRQVERMASAAQSQAGVHARSAAVARLRTVAPGAEVEVSPLVAGAEMVRSATGALTPAAPGRSAVDVALGFLRDHAAVYGLTAGQVNGLQVLGESRSPSGLRVVRLRQQVHGLTVFQSETRVAVDRAGRLIRTVGRLVPGIVEDLVPAPQARLSSKDTLAAAMASVGLALEPARMNVHSELVYFPLGPGALVPAWAQVTAIPDGEADWYTVVDARTGILLYRKNLRSHWRDPLASAGEAAAAAQPARFGVYVQPDGVTPADNPAPQSPNTVQVGEGTQFPAISRSIVDMFTAQSLQASPGGWLPDDVEITSGPNVIAYVDRDADDKPDPGALDADGFPKGNLDAQGKRRDFIFNFTPAPLGSDPDQGAEPSDPASQRGAVTNLFYITNWYHDRLHELGFDAAAGNYEGDDPVLALAQQGADKGRANNANFFPPPDGQSGIMRMFLFNNPSPQRDGSLDADTIIHELTHGVSNRLIGDSAGLNWFPGLGMGEGWSDFFELSLLNGTQADDPDGQYPAGPYVTYNFQGLTDNYVYGIRRFPYTTDNSINPLTWADVDDTTVDLTGGIEVSPLGLEFGGAKEVHNTGEVWALTLWEVRSRIIAAHGHNVAMGSQITLQIVTDALKMTPIDPSFLQARDALIDADCAANDCAHEAEIWGGFADRGLGFGARTSRGISFHHGVGESFSLPVLTPVEVGISDAAPGGNGNGSIDPNETINVTVELLNPWRNAEQAVGSATGTLTCAHPGTKVTDAKSAYGPIAAQGTAIGDRFSVKVGKVRCGESLACTLKIESALGTASFPVALRLGKAAGLEPPGVFTRNAGGIEIPDPLFQGAVGGVNDELSILEDVVIGDLDLRVDDLRHPFVGDLAVVLKGPDGFAADLIYRPAGSPDNELGLNDGRNFFQTVIDDEAEADLMVEPGLSAPFIGSWLPALNSPLWTPTPDLVPQLSNFDGMSTKGKWTLYVEDAFPESVGTLNSWSLIVSPVRFACSGGQPETRLLSIQSEGRTFSGQRVTTETRIFRQGLTQVEVLFEPPGTGSTGQGKPESIMVGVGSKQALRRLRGALTDGQVASREGNCGDPGDRYPLGFVSHTVTWFGLTGQIHTFTVGGDFTPCDAKTRDVLNAIGNYLVGVSETPGTVFVGPPPVLPFD